MSKKHLGKKWLSLALCVCMMSSLVSCPMAAFAEEPEEVVPTPIEAVAELPAPEPVAEPAAESVPEPEPAPAPAPVYAPVAEEPVGESAPEPAAEPGSETETESESESATEAETESVALSLDGGDSGDTETSAPTITGLTVEVKDASGNTVQPVNGVYTIRPDFLQVIITAKGTNLDQATYYDCWVNVRAGLSDYIASWTENETDGSWSGSFDPASFSSCEEVFEIQYSNDNRNTWFDTGIKLLYSDGSSSGGDSGSGDSLDTNAEAWWGASKDSLTGSGSLEQAFGAADGDSSVKYIRLQNDVDADSEYNITGGAFTLDLNGHKITNTEKDYVIAVLTWSGVPAEVTFDDSSESKSGGIVGSKGNNGKAVFVNAGKATFAGGSYSGYYAVVVENGASVTVTGGTFDGTTADFLYNKDNNATLDLSKYGTINGLTVYNYIVGVSVGTSGTNILLPTGCWFYKSSDANKTSVDALDEEAIYVIHSDGSSTPGGGDTTSDEAVITGISITIDGTEYTSTNTSATNPAKVKLNSTVTLTVYGTNLDNANEKMGVYYTGNYSGGYSEDDFTRSGVYLYNKDKWTFNSDNTIATTTIGASEFENCTGAYQLGYDIKHGEGDYREKKTGIYVTCQPKAEITGLSITIDGKEYTSTNTSATNPAVVTSTSSVMLTVTGTDLDNPNGEAYVAYVGIGSTSSAIWLKDANWTRNTDNTTATITIAASAYEECTEVFELTYTSGVYEEHAGIYVIYDSRKDTDEAWWGMSKDSMIHGGTLAQAFEAAQYDGIQYIQLQNSVTTAGYYNVTVGTFTLDFNGKTVSGMISLRDSSADVTFVDGSAGDPGGVTRSSGMAIEVSEGKLTIQSGCFSSSDQTAVSNTGGTLTISGGTFSGNGADVDARSTTTITGGTFNACIAYYSGKLDLAGYPTTDKTGTTAIGELTVCAVYAVVVGDTTIQLPAGYSFYRKDDTGKLAMMTLAAGKRYAIGETSKLTEVEAIWGASATSMTDGGALVDALSVAAEEGSDVKYIRLQKDLTTESGYSITGGAFTLDLGGKTVSSSGNQGFYIDGGTVDVIFTDTATGGKVECTETSATSAIRMNNGKLTVTGGSYSGDSALLMYSAEATVTATISGGSFTANGDYTVDIYTGSTLTIEGGTFTAGKDLAVAVDGTVTIKGGSFTAGKDGHIGYWGGKLDLANYPTTDTTGTTAIGDLTVKNYMDEAVTPGESTIQLPTDYAFYKAGDARQTIVTELAASGKYSIKKDVEAKWGTSETSLTDGGTLKEAFEAAKDNSSVKYIQLQKDLTTHSYYSIVGGNIGSTLTLDLNGYTISGGLSITGGAVTLADTVGSGAVINSDGNAISVSQATVTITGGTYRTTTGAVLVCDSSSNVTIEGGRFIGAGKNSTIASSSWMTILGGYFQATADNTPAISNSGGAMTIMGGTFSATGTNAAAIENRALLTISGGTFSATGASIANYKGLTVTGGTFKAGFDYYGGTINLSGHSGAGLAGLTVTNKSDGELAYNETNASIQLPSGYVFYLSGDANKATVNGLKAGKTYVINGSTTTDDAKITGVSVEVKDTSESAVAPSNGVYTIQKGYTVTITATGTSLDAGGDLLVQLIPDTNKSLSGDGWEYNSDNTSATHTFTAAEMAACTAAHQLQYSSDNGTSWTKTGIYIQYQRILSVSIQWGALAFVYSDGLDGNAVGWSATDNTITVTNNGDESVCPTVSYVAEEAYKAISSTVTGNDGTLAAEQSVTFTLKLSGEPTAAIAAGTAIGEVTVTLDAAEEVNNSEGG